MAPKITLGRKIKKKKARKAEKKLKKLRKEKKLKRHVIDRMKDIKARKSVDARQRALQVLI